jgi:hypothetical protein
VVVAAGTSCRPSDSRLHRRRGRTPRGAPALLLPEGPRT